MPDNVYPKFHDNYLKVVKTSKRNKRRNFRICSIKLWIMWVQMRRAANNKIGVQ